MTTINGTGFNPYVYNAGSPNQTGSTGTNYNSNAYGSDGFSSSGSYSALSSGGMSYPISQIMAEDPSLAGRFGKWFMGTSDRFLKVGTNWLGRMFVNLVAGNIPLFTSRAESASISNNVNLWLGRSDLVRTGMTPYQATLLQDAGIQNVNDLSIVTNPGDQVVVAQMMTAASANRGYPIMVDQMMVSGWVSQAQQLDKYF